MKLSICIPVYNFDVRNLIHDLLIQINHENLDAEIVIIDDCSSLEFTSKIKEIENLVSKVIYLPKNIGRSKIRNLFLEYTSGEYLLFLDCDGKIIRNDFLKTYVDSIIKVNPDVIYGGRVVSDELPSSDYQLRWSFAHNRENLCLKQRLHIPYRSFQTNNFVIKKEVFKKFQFNENLNQYGYEDLLFAMDLRQEKVPIFHIDNPILNDDVEKNDIFLLKAKESAESLAKILKNPDDAKKVDDLKLTKAYNFLKRNKLRTIFATFFWLSEKFIVKKLLSGNASLRFLDIYKLGKLVQSMR